MGYCGMGASTASLHAALLLIYRILKYVTIYDTRLTIDDTIDEHGVPGSRVRVGVTEAIKLKQELKLRIRR